MKACGIALGLFLSSLAYADFKVTDQEGRTLAFYKDVVAQKSVIAQFVYTHCEGVCPAQGQRFQLLQKLIQDDPTIQLLSISIDPEQDEARDMKRWSQAYGAGPRWTLLRSERSITDALTLDILVMKLSRNEHSPFVAIRPSGGTWQRLYGLSSAKHILSELKTLKDQL